MASVTVTRINRQDQISETYRKCLMRYFACTVVVTADNSDDARKLVDSALNDAFAKRHYPISEIAKYVTCADCPGCPEYPLFTNSVQAV